MKPKSESWFLKISHYVIIYIISLLGFMQTKQIFLYSTATLLMRSLLYPLSSQGLITDKYLHWTVLISTHYTSLSHRSFYVFMKVDVALGFSF